MPHYHKVTDQVTQLLDQHDVWYETFEHEPVLTSEQAAQVRPGYTLHQGAKAIVVRYKDKDKQEQFTMLVLPADLRFDKKKLRKCLGVKNFRFADTQEVERLTGGVLAGGIPPFGNLFGLNVIADPLLFENPKIVFNAGDRCFSVAMLAEDFRNIVRPKIEEIAG